MDNTWEVCVICTYSYKHIQPFCNIFLALNLYFMLLSNIDLQNSSGQEISMELCSYPSCRHAEFSTSSHHQIVLLPPIPQTNMMIF